MEKLPVMLILASKSPIRRALLGNAGLRFTVVPAHVDERAIEAEGDASGADPRTIALLLAKAKAIEVSARVPAAVVIGGDQVLALGLERLHKPPDMPAARAQLDRLRNKTHRLHAGVALARGGDVMWADVQSAELSLRDFTDTERDQVLALEGEAALGSVGGYRLEGPSIRLFGTVEGDYFTILGLPLLQVLEALRNVAPEVLS